MTRAGASATPLGEANGRRDRLLEDVPVLAVIALTSLYHLWILRGLFYGYAFAFHDLGIITDWFTNAVYRGRPFWISDMAVNHLSVHFTPSLLLWTPAYLLSDSSAVLLLVSVLCVAVGLYEVHRLFLLAAAAARVDTRWAVSASTLLTAILSLNPYVRTVLASAHVEVFYVPLALAFLRQLLFGTRPAVLWILFALSVGVREEAALYLGAQCLAVLFLPRHWWRNGASRKALAFALAIVCGLYLVLIVKVVNPLVFGAVDNHVARGWSGWGASWPSVVWEMATSPVRLLLEAGRSAFLPLNGTFFFLPWFSAPFGALVNAPGLLLFASDRMDAKYLWYYHASFILPGLILGTHAGALELLRLARRFRFRSDRTRMLYGLTVVSAGVLALGVLISGREWTPEAPTAYGNRFSARAFEDARFLESWMAAHPEVRSAATDFRRLVYLPNRVERFLLRNADRAEVVFLFPEGDPFMSGSTSMAALQERLDVDRRWVVREDSSGVRVYVKREIEARLREP